MRRKQPVKLATDVVSTNLNRVFYRYDVDLGGNHVFLGDLKYTVGEDTINVNSIPGAHSSLIEFNRQYGIINKVDILGRENNGVRSGYAKYRHELLSYITQLMVSKVVSYSKTDVQVPDVLSGGYIPNFTPDLMFRRGELLQQPSNKAVDNIIFEVKGLEAEGRVANTIVTETLNKAKDCLAKHIRTKYAVIVYSGRNVALYTDLDSVYANQMIYSIDKNKTRIKQAFEYFSKLKQIAQTKLDGQLDANGTVMYENIKSMSNAVFNSYTDPFILKENDKPSIFSDDLKGLNDARGIIRAKFQSDADWYLKEVVDARRISHSEVDALVKDIKANYKAKQQEVINSIAIDRKDIPQIREAKCIAGNPVYCYNSKIMPDLLYDLVEDTRTHVTMNTRGMDQDERDALVHLWGECLLGAYNLEVDVNNVVDAENVIDENKLDGEFAKTVIGEKSKPSTIKLLNLVRVNETDVKKLVHQALKSKLAKQTTKKTPIYAKTPEGNVIRESKLNRRKVIGYDIVALEDTTVAREAAATRFLKSIPKDLDNKGVADIDQFMLSQTNTKSDAVLPDGIADQFNTIVDMITDSARITNGNLVNQMNIGESYKRLFKDRFINSLFIEHLIMLEVQNNAVVINDGDTMTIFKIKALGIYVLLTSSGPSKFINYSLMIPKANYKLVDDKVFGKYTEGNKFYITHFKTSDGLRSKVAISIFGAYITNLVTIMPLYIDSSDMVRDVNNNHDIVGTYFKIMNSNKLTGRTLLEDEYVKMLKMDYMLLYANRSSDNLLFKAGRYLHGQLMQPYYTVTKAHELFKEKIPYYLRTSLQTYIYRNMINALAIGMKSDIIMGNRAKVTNFLGPKNYNGSDCIEGMINIATGGPCFSQALIAVINNFEATNDKHFKGNPKYSTLAAYDKALEYYSSFNKIVHNVRNAGIVGDLESPNKSGLFNRTYTEAISKVGANNIVNLVSDADRDAFFKTFCNQTAGVDTYSLTSTSASLDYEKFRDKVEHKQYSKGDIMESTSGKVFSEIYNAKYMTGVVFRDIKTITDHLLMIRTDPSMVGKLFFKDERGKREVVVEDIESMLLIKLVELYCVHVTKNCPEDAITNKEASKKVIPGHYDKVKAVANNKKGWVTIVSILLTADLSKYGPGTNIRTLFIQLKNVLPSVTWDAFMFILNLVINKKILICQDIIDDFHKEAGKYTSSFTGLMSLYQQIFEGDKIIRSYFKMGLGFVQGVLQMTANLQHANLLRSNTPEIENWCRNKITKYLQDNIMADGYNFSNDYGVEIVVTNVMGADDSAHMVSAIISLPRENVRAFKESFGGESQTNKDIQIELMRDYAEKVLYSSLKGLDKAYNYVGWKRSEEKSSFSNQKFVEFYSRFFIGKSEISQSKKFVLPAMFKSVESSFTDTFDAFATGVGAFVEQGGSAIANIYTQYSQGIIHYSTIGLILNKNLVLLNDIRSVMLPQLGYFPVACAFINIGHRYFSHRLSNNIWYCRMLNAMKLMYGSKITKDGVKVHVRIAPIRLSKQEQVKENMKLTINSKELNDLTNTEIFNVLNSTMDKELTDKMIAHKVNGIRFADTIASRSSLQNYRLLYIGSGFAATRGQNTKDRLKEVADYLLSINGATASHTKVIELLKSIEVESTVEMSALNASTISDDKSLTISRINSYYSLNKSSLHHMIRTVMLIDKFITSTRSIIHRWVDECIEIIDQYKPKVGFTNKAYCIDNFDTITIPALKKLAGQVYLLQGGKEMSREIDKAITILSAYPGWFQIIYDNYIEVVTKYQKEYKTAINPLRLMAQSISNITIYKDNTHNPEPFESSLVYNVIDKQISGTKYQLLSSTIHDRQTASIAIATGVEHDLELTTVLSQLWFPEVAIMKSELNDYKEPLYSVDQLLQNLRGYKTSLPFLEMSLEDTKANCQEEELITIIDMIKSRVREVRHFRSNPRYKPNKSRKLGLDNLLKQQIKYNFINGIKLIHASDSDVQHEELTKYPGYSEVLKVVESYLILSRLAANQMLKIGMVKQIINKLSNTIFTGVEYHNLMLIARSMSRNPLLKSQSKDIMNLINLAYVNGGGNTNDVGLVAMNDPKMIAFLEKREKVEVQDNGIKTWEYVGLGRCIARHNEFYTLFHMSDNILVAIEVEEKMVQLMPTFYNQILRIANKLKLQINNAAPGQVYDLKTGKIEVKKIINIYNQILETGSGLPVRIVNNDANKNKLVDRLNASMIRGGEINYDVSSDTIYCDNNDKSDYHAMSVVKLKRCDMTSDFRDPKFVVELLTAANITAYGKVLSNAPLFGKKKGVDYDHTMQIAHAIDNEKGAFSGLIDKLNSDISDRAIFETATLKIKINYIKLIKNVLNEALFQYTNKPKTNTYKRMERLRNFIRGTGLHEKRGSVNDSYNWVLYRDMGIIASSLIDILDDKDLVKFNEVDTSSDGAQHPGDTDKARPEINDMFDFDIVVDEDIYYNPDEGDEVVYDDEDKEGNSFSFIFEEELMLARKVESKVVKLKHRHRSNEAAYWNQILIGPIMKQVTGQSLILFAMYKESIANPASLTQLAPEPFRMLRRIFTGYDGGRGIGVINRVLYDIHTLLQEIYDLCQTVLNNTIEDDESTAYYSSSDDNEYLSDFTVDTKGDDYGDILG